MVIKEVLAVEDVGKEASSLLPDINNIARLISKLRNFLFHTDCWHITVFSDLNKEAFTEVVFISTSEDNTTP